MEQAVFFSNDHLIRTGSHFLNIDRMPHGKPKPFPLSYRIMDDALMLSQDPSRFVHIIAGAGHRIFGMLSDIIRVMAFRHETDLLGIRRGGAGKTGVCRDLSDVIFIISSQRHNRSG